MGEAAGIGTGMNRYTITSSEGSNINLSLIVVNEIMRDNIDYVPYVRVKQFVGDGRHLSSASSRLIWRSDGKDGTGLKTVKQVHKLTAHFGGDPKVREL